MEFVYSGSQLFKPVVAFVYTGSGVCLHRKWHLFTPEVVCQLFVYTGSQLFVYIFTPEVDQLTGSQLFKLEVVFVYTGSQLFTPEVNQLTGSGVSALCLHRKSAVCLHFTPEVDQLTGSQLFVYFLCTGSTSADRKSAV